jgi:hypothetical protein
VSKLVLGKTAAALLLKAAAQPAGLVSTLVARAQRGGRSYGRRDAAAAIAATKAGLLERVEHSSHTVYRYGWGTNVHEALYRITDAGRAALAGRAS